ncbi:MAG: hypothetical protein K6U74_16890, partial [Firmicutes bacterium]|nr:hypothetical protein [Bacillota bacterium]
SSIVRYAVGRFLGGVVDGIITFFLFGALTAMAAGAGAIFAEQFGLPKAAGSISMIITSLLTVLLGFHGVVMAISFVVPVLLISVLGLSAATLVNTPIDFEAVKLWATAAKPAIPLWPVSALAYVSYNIILSLCILAPLGSKAASTAVTAKGALWGGLGLFLGALAINLAILTVPFRAARLEIPMIYIAGQFSPLVQAGYALVLLAEIYTTAVANLYGFTARLAPSETPRFKQIAAATAVAAFTASLLGFSALVRYLYSAVGIAGFLFLGGLAYRFLQKESTRA